MNYITRIILNPKRRFLGDDEMERNFVNVINLAMSVNSY